MKKVLCASLLMLLMTVAAMAQTTTVQTTTSAAITAGTAGSLTFAVASTSSMSASSSANGRRFILIDTELMELTSIPVSGTVTVTRAQNATNQQPHISGARVTWGPAGIWSPSTQNTGGATTGVFLARDPVGSCTAASQQYTIVVNIAKATQWSCVTGTWTPVAGLTDGRLMEVSFHGQLAAAQVDQSFFLATRAYQVIAISEVHAVAEATAGTLRVQVTKDTTTDAPGAGTDLLTNTSNAGFDSKATANTVQTGTLISTLSSLILAAGDRLSVDFTAAATELVGTTITVTLKPLP